MSLLDELFTPEEQGSLSPLLLGLAREGRALASCATRMALDEERSLGCLQSTEAPRRVTALAAQHHPLAQQGYSSQHFSVQLEPTAGGVGWQARLIRGRAGASLELAGTSLPIGRRPAPLPLEQLPSSLVLLDREGELHILQADPLS